MRQGERVAPTIERIDDIDVFRIEDNEGVQWHDVIRAVIREGKTLNDVPVQIAGERVFANGVYSNKELKVALALGHVVCDPKPTKLSGSSIDVRLGEHFFLAGNPREVNGIFNPFDQEDTLRYFGDAKVAKAAKIVIQKALKNLDHLIESGVITQKTYKARREHLHDTDEIKNLDPEHPIILLRPGERILAHTEEFIGIRAPGTTSMQTRSTIGRTGIATCFCAGWGDPGYINRWTMEINNLNEFEYLPLAHGQRVAQIVFSSTGPVENEYANTTGKYQTVSSDDLEGLKASWSPQQILPQQHKDIADLDAWRARQLDAIAT